MSDVTVAIPTRGDRPSIRSTIDSILVSAAPTDVELLIVWSGRISPPGWGLSLPGQPRHLPIETLGLSVARNAALRAGTSQFVIMPDDDVICSSSWFNAMVSALDDGADLVGGPVALRWPNERPGWLTPSMEAIFGAFDAGPSSFDLSRAGSLVGGNMGARADVVLEIGGYEEALGTRGRAGLMGEETELCDRALARGLRVTYVANAPVTHVLEASGLTRREYLRRMYRFGQSMSLVRGPQGPSRARKAAAAGRRMVAAPFGGGLEQLGSAAFELGSARS